MKQIVLPKQVDWILLLPVCFIPLFGLAMLRSTSPQLFTQQLINMAIGAVIFLLIVRLDLTLLKQFAVPLYIGSILLLLSVFIFGDPTRGSYRWLELGYFRLQPSEIVKPLLVISFAAFLSQRQMKKLPNVLQALALFFIPFIIIFKEPDLGSAVVIAFLFFGMLFMSGIRMLHVFVLAVVLLASLPIGWQFTHEYQRERVFTFLNPQKDPLGKTYNINQSVIAVGSGELAGRGLGHGTQTQLKFLPEHSTDFIFASLGEELGFIGASVLILLYMLVFWRLLRISEGTADTFSALLLFGIATILFTQAFIHIGGNIGILPVTGITLPLVSYGGSSVFATAILLGLLFSAATTVKTQRVSG